MIKKRWKVELVPEKPGTFAVSRTVLADSMILEADYVVFKSGTKIEKVFAIHAIRFIERDGEVEL